MKTKKSVSVFLAMILALLLALPAAAAAAQPSGFNLFDDTLDVVADRICAALADGRTEADVSDLHLNADSVGNGSDMFDFLRAFQNDHPEFFYIRSFGYSSRNGVVTGVRFIPYEDYTAENIAAANETVANAAALADALELSELDRVLLAVNFMKDRSYCGGSEDGKHSTAFDALMTENATPFAHAYAMTWVLRAMGLEAYYVSGGNNACPFVLVFVNGKGYFIDMTVTEFYNRGILLSEEKLRADRHDLDETSVLTVCEWKSAAGICTDQTYDTAWWQGTVNEMGFCGGQWYYTDGLDLFRGAAAAPEAGTKLTSHSADDYAWFRRNSSGMQGCDVAAFGGTVYFTAPAAVMQYNVSTGEESLFYLLEDAEASYGYIYDISIYGNRLTYKVSDSRAAFDYVGYTKYKNEIELVCAAHAFGAWTVTDPGTCVTKATEHRICGLCRLEETREADFYGEHSFSEWTPTQAATCMQQGVEARTCAYCPEQETRETGFAPHALGAWTVTKEATCAEKGEEKAACTTAGCTYAETREIPATGRHVDADGDELCDVCHAEMKNPLSGIAEFFAKIRAFFEKIIAFFRGLFSRG